MPIAVSSGSRLFHTLVFACDAEVIADVCRIAG
jgi:hypothetical protein